MAAPIWTILVIIPVFGYLVAVLYLIIRELQPKGTKKFPLDMLKERFAKGEITSDEFEQGKGCNPGVAGICFFLPRAIKND